MDKNFAYTDHDLPKEIAAGNAEAFTQLYDQYHQKIYNLALHITRTELIAEDLMQDVFIKVWEKRAGLSAVDNISGWLTIIARNTAIDYLRRLGDEHLGLEGLARKEPANNRFTQNDAATREYEQLLKAAIDQLTPGLETGYFNNKRIFSFPGNRLSHNCMFIFKKDALRSLAMLDVNQEQQDKFSLELISKKFNLYASVIPLHDTTPELRLEVDEGKNRMNSINQCCLLLLFHCRLHGNKTARWYN